jgi:rare lipoprotein A
MRPYIVNGRMYYPTVVHTGNIYRGIASWYGPNFHGKKTSNGEWYDMYAMTAAHKTLPMNTVVKVTNLLNGKSAIVRINDRGPFVKNRIIDLSYAAAKKIGVVASGTAPVRLEILGFNGKITTASNKTKSSVTLSNFSVQIGSFRRYEGAKIYKNRYDGFQHRYHTAIVKGFYKGSPIYRVWLSGFKSENEARDFIRQGEFPGAFIVRK